jgi:hypothetical protein
MRYPVRLVVFAVVAVAIVGVAGGQQFGGFGFGGKKGTSYITLANNPQVRGELKMTEAQAAKLPEAELKALRDVLDEGQLKRLQQIYRQQRGNFAYLDADVKKELKITDEQTTKIQAALDKQAKDQAEMFQSGFDADRLQEIQKSANDAVKATLTEQQKTAWTKLVGETFELQFKGFGKKN